MEYEYIPTNRDKVKSPSRSGFYWCGGCDANHVSDGQKCDVCGHLNGVKRFKPGKPY